MSRTPLNATIVLTTLLVAALGFWTSAELLGAILFTLPLTLCAVQRSRRMLWTTAAAAALFTLLAQMWGFQRGASENPWLVALVNRSLLIVSLLALAGFIHQWMGKGRKIERNADEIRRQSASLLTQNRQLEQLMQTVTQELAERRASEASLAQMERKYRGLLEAAPDALVVVDEAGRITVLNARTEQLFGHARAELLGLPIETLVPERFRTRHTGHRGGFFTDPRVRTIGARTEIYAKRKDGSEFPVEINLSPLASAEGILVTAAIRDVTERNAAASHLVQMEARQRGLLEAAPDAMVLVDESGTIVLVNLQTELQFGYPRNELVGQPLETIIPEVWIMAPEVKRRLAEAVDSATSLPAVVGACIELAGRHRSGRDLPIEITLSTLRGPEGIQMTVAIRDISARRQVDARLRVIATELSRSNEELGQFAYVASHDLQEPLRMVASYTELLSKRYKGRLDADADEFIAFAVDGANRMQLLIQDLLSYSRIGTKARVLVDTSSEVALAQALVNLGGAIEKSGARVTHDPLPVVRADAAQLVQLFQNLVGNAIKYQNPGVPEIHVSSVESGGRWAFSVRDNGLGIESRYFDRVFVMFQRLHKRDEFTGTGVGLAICKKIVEQHGGQISVESQPGRGSTFHFALAGGMGTP